MNSHKKAAKEVAKKLAKGGLTKKQKARAVSKWALHMKALIKSGK